MAIPAEIKNLRPTEFGTVEVQVKSGHYYVYPISSKWDSEKKRPKKTTGKCIGKITLSDGFIPNAHGMILLNQKKAIPDVTPHVRNYGAYELMRRLSPDLEDQLKKHFPDIFREIRTIALLRLVDGVSSAKAVRPAFLSSYMSEPCGDLSLAETTVRTFVDKLGLMRDRTEAFMRDSVMPGATLMFDGTVIFTCVCDSLSEYGYNPTGKKRRQARLLYVFDKDSQKPVFYCVLPGSFVDRAAFISTVKAAGCKDCTVIADKGFYSKTNISALMQANLKFILPLNENTTLIDDEFYENLDDKKFDGVFTYNNRPIWFVKKSCGNQGNIVYTYRDDIRMSEERGHFIGRAEANYDEGKNKPMDVLNKKRLGYFSFVSNLDISAEELYYEYKQRGDIEQMFDYLKNSISKSASYAHTDEYFKGWAFLNHISALYYYGLINALRKADGLDGLSADEVIKLTKNIYMVDYGNGYRVSEIQQGTQRILEALGVDLST